MKEVIVDSGALSDIKFLESQGFFFIHKTSEGFYRAQHGITTFYGLYLENGVVKQK